VSTSISIEENKLYLVFEVMDSGKIQLLHFSSAPYEDETLNDQQKKEFDLVGLNVTGAGRDEHHGGKYTWTMPGMNLKYLAHRDTRNERGRKIEVVMYDKETALEVTSHYQFFDGVSVIRCWTEVVNKGGEAQGLEYVTSFALFGLSKEGLLDRDDKMRLHIAHSGWTSELQWREYSLPELGLAHINNRGAKRIAFSTTGSWSSTEYMPVALLENQETGTNLFWQIEHNGSWYWEISDLVDQLYLHISGPTENEHHWWKNLKPKESFTTVPVAVGAASTGFDGAMGELTKYRRKIRRPNKDNELLGIIFNDYMNCLWGDPTTEKLLPLIDAAAGAGCEYFCIDAGWYSAGPWWDGVGQWLPSEERFPGGIKPVIDYIRSKGMIPGLWLEIEVMGVKSPKLSETNDSWFFQRHGKKIIDRFRYQLDFRTPEVVKHADGVIDRLVQEYGVGYIKMDYNINAGIGTEVDADSFGDGLLQHNRAYLAWLDKTFAKYPDLIIENCSSGGMRMDYAMLSRHSIQSTSDQEDYRHYAVIAANSPTCVTPEQSAIWSYPLREGDNEEVVFNMVNAMLLRIHQSGHLAQISPERKALVKEALDYYKSIRKSINAGLPIWPLGTAKFKDPWVSLGMMHEDRTYLAVWRLEGSGDTCTLPLTHLKGKAVEVECGYPAKTEGSWQWNSESGLLTVRHPVPISARLYCLKIKHG
jgi:alpha-galactosidase